MLKEGGAWLKPNPAFAAGCAGVGAGLEPNWKTPDDCPLEKLKFELPNGNPAPPAGAALDPKAGGAICCPNPGVCTLLVSDPNAGTF